jgi:hypothetical protein
MNYILTFDCDASEQNFVLAAIDGLLVLFNKANNKQFNSTALLGQRVSMVSWHPGGNFMAVCTDQGIYFFDYGLSLLMLHFNFNYITKNIQIAPFLRFWFCFYCLLTLNREKTDIKLIQWIDSKDEEHRVQQEVVPAIKYYLLLLYEKYHNF